MRHPPNNRDMSLSAAASIDLMAATRWHARHQFARSVAACHAPVPAIPAVAAPATHAMRLRYALILRLQQITRRPVADAGGAHPYPRFCAFIRWCSLSATSAPTACTDPHHQRRRGLRRPIARRRIILHHHFARRNTAHGRIICPSDSTPPGNPPPAIPAPCVIHC